MTQQTQTDDHIRDAAYFLWLKDGQPEGRDQEHWLAAQAELTVETVVETPKPKAPRKKAAAKPRAAKAAAATKAEVASKPAAKPKKPRATKAAKAE
ncbi:DUF2934 domain-containing protein [Celeribacter baekdonensis]|uniref:DUF2934 domain-containing protein n=1 Tax=Celeribacter baekdonensis TaxID=875171 RepID=A0A2R4M2D1_9RHOB|nr:DUF2934 domain-containing protein [Celeribacter baekdonensis]AVW91267.1 DUF2934 domain-containing protein [Celeribacter baekdonensis]